MKALNDAAAVKIMKDKDVASAKVIEEKAVKTSDEQEDIITGNVKEKPKIGIDLKKEK